MRIYTFIGTLRNGFLYVQHFPFPIVNYDDYSHIKDKSVFHLIKRQDRYIILQVFVLPKVSDEYLKINTKLISP